MAGALKNFPADIFISSPLKRALMTVKICAEFQGKDNIRIEPRFSEINHGVWSGQFISDIGKNYPDDFKIWQTLPHKFKMPGGESLNDVSIRANSALVEIIKENPGKTVLIGAHGTINSVMLCNFAGLSLENVLKFPQDNACINLLEIENDDRKILLKNFVDYQTTREIKTETT